jgi:predicted transposase YbfD/YdcC
LGQRQGCERSNEITAGPALLRQLKLAGCLVTANALARQDPPLAGSTPTVDKGHGRLETRRYWQSGAVAQSQLLSAFGIHPLQLTAWKKQAVATMPENFGARREGCFL